MVWAKEETRLDYRHSQEIFLFPKESWGQTNFIFLWSGRKRNRALITGKAKRVFSSPKNPGVKLTSSSYGLGERGNAP